MEMGQGVMTSLPRLLADDLDPHAARDAGSMAGHRRDAGIPPARCVGRFCREAVPGATGLVRGVARATHNFTNQCFLDELARTIGKDPCPLDAERREGAERRAAVGGIGELVVSMSEEDEG